MDYYRFEEINEAIRHRKPGVVHYQNTALSQFYTDYFLEKIIGMYEFKNLPEEWSKSYFLYTLFLAGHITVFDSKKYGLSALRGELYGYNLYYQPTNSIIANPLINGLDLKIGEDCEIIKLRPNYQGVYDIVTQYGGLMASALDAASVNIFNSKQSLIAFAGNKNLANTYKAAYDKFSQGHPFIVADDRLINKATGKMDMEMFNQNLSQNYIADKQLETVRMIDNMFNEHIGLPNTNVEKKERMIKDEVNANNQSTEVTSKLWLDHMNECLEKVNNMFGTNISVDFKFKQLSLTNEEGGNDDDLRESMESV